MNELQLVLLVFAVVVIGVLYFFSKKRQNKSQDSEDQSVERTPSETTSRQRNANENNSLEQGPQMSSAGMQSPKSEPDPAIDSEVPDNQGRLLFEDEFSQSQADAATQPEFTAETSMETIEIEKIEIHSQRTANHHVLEVDDLYSVSEMGGAGSGDDAPRSNFGIPEDNAPAANQTPSKSQGEHQVFALLVLSTGGSGQEFAMDAVNQALLGVGLTFSKQDIYVTMDSQGSEIIRVANIMEPGTFPTENLHSHTTPGLALILELPSSVRAPAAMHDLIMMARKVSQRLNGRLYNMERHLIKESDLQAMRDAAVDYESEPL